MADILDTSGWGAKAAQMGNTVHDYGIWFMLIGLVVVLIAILFWYLSFKNTVVIRLRTKNGKRIKHVHAKQIIKDGVPYWRIRELFKNVTPPPPNAIETLQNGKLYAECYWSDDNPEPIWLADTDKTDASFQPFNTQERALHVQRVTNAAQRKKKGVLDVIMQLAPMLLCVIIIVMVFAFWGDITAPLQEISKRQAEAAANMARISEQQARIMGVFAGTIPPDQLNISQTITSGG